jgi:hypothetical protein
LINEGISAARAAGVCLAAHSEYKGHDDSACLSRLLREEIRIKLCHVRELSILSKPDNFYFREKFKEMPIFSIDFIGNYEYGL